MRCRFLFKRLTFLHMKVSTVMTFTPAFTNIAHNSVSHIDLRKSIKVRTDTAAKSTNNI